MFLPFHACLDSLDRLGALDVLANLAAPANLKRSGF